MTALEVAKDVWAAICATYDINPDDVTPVFWIEDAIKMRGKQSPVPGHVVRRVASNRAHRGLTNG